MLTSRCFLLSSVTGIVWLSFLLCISQWHTDLQFIMERASARSWKGLSTSTKANLKINLSKCQFFKKHLHYLGHLISQQGIQPLPDKSISHTTDKEAKLCGKTLAFPGLRGHYREIVPLFANVTRPLNKPLKKDKRFKWSPQCQAAFKHLKQALCREPILQYPSMEGLKTVHVVYWHQLLWIFWSPYPGSWKSWGSEACSVYIGLILWNAAKVICNQKGGVCSLPVHS